MDDQALSLDVESVLIGDALGEELDAVVAEYLEAAARDTAQMIVLGLVAGGLEAQESLAEVALDDEPALDQDVERAIDGGGSHPGASRAESVRDLLGGEVVVGREQEFRDRQALRSDGKISLAQPRREALHEGLVGHGLAGEALDGVDYGVFRHAGSLRSA